MAKASFEVNKEAKNYNKYLLLPGKRCISMLSTPPGGHKQH